MGLLRAAPWGRDRVGVAAQPAAAVEPKNRPRLPFQLVTRPPRRKRTPPASGFLGSARDPVADTSVSRRALSGKYFRLQMGAMPEIYPRSDAPRISLPNSARWLPHPNAEFVAECERATGYSPPLA